MKANYNKKEPAVRDRLPVYVWDIDEFEKSDGISIMSIVGDPAVEKNFMCFSRSGGRASQFRYSLNEEKRIITGVAIRADYPIYRNDENGEYYTVFDAKVIEKLVYKFMRDMRHKEVNVNHSASVEGVYLIESFFLSQAHRLSWPEFADVAPGSWITSYKVDNDQLWQQIKAGRLNGFSIEVSGTINETEKYNGIDLRGLYETIRTLDGRV